MKKLAGLVFILLALLMGGYYGMGILTERTLKKNIDVINKSNGVFVDITQYNRGWFVSSAELNIKLNIPERTVKDQNNQMTIVPAQTYSMQVPFEVYHGPIIYHKSSVMFGLGYANTRLDLPEAVSEKIYERFTQKSNLPALDLSVFVSYLNRSNFEINLPQFKLFGKDNNGKMEWLGMNGELSISNDKKSIDGNLNLKGINFSKANVKAILGPFENSFDINKTDFGLYLGKASVNLPSLLIADNGKAIFKLNKFKVESDSGITNGLLSSTFNLSLDEVVANGQTYGPAKFDMSINNLDAEVLAQISEQANNIQQGTDAERQQAMFAIIPELPKLVGKGANFEISTLSVRLPEGDFKGNLKISLPKGVSGNPFKLLQKVHGEGSIQMPSAIVKQLVEESVKQKLMQQSALQQAMVAQMQSNSSTTASQTQKPETASVDAQSTESSTSGAATQSTTMTEEAAAKQAAEETNNKLSALIGAKLLIEKGSDYMVKFKFEQGQLTINGQPFNPAMLKP